jgi:hypothetical protein
MVVGQQYAHRVSVSPLSAGGGPHVLFQVSAWVLPRFQSSAWLWPALLGKSLAPGGLLREHLNGGEGLSIG